MASYRYERNITEEDVRSVKERTYTRKERWNNWWDYNLKWVVIAVIVVGFVGYSFIGQYFFTVHPDYNIGVVAPYYLPEDTVNALETQLAAFGEDLNGDGQTVVTLNVYTLNYSEDTQSDTDAYLTMAGTTRLAADVQGAMSAIYILYDPAGFEENTGSLRYLDGSLPAGDTDEDWWNMVYRWTDCPVLTGLDLGSYTGYTSVDEAQGSNQDVLKNLYLGFRGDWSGEENPTRDGAWQLWQKLTAGAESTASES